VTLKKIQQDGYSVGTDRASLRRKQGTETRTHENNANVRLSVGRIAAADINKQRWREQVGTRWPLRSIVRFPFSLLEQERFFHWSIPSWIFPSLFSTASTS
jgi:hypothetical protein